MSKYKSLIRNTDPKALDQQVVGAGNGTKRYLDPGEFDVVVAGVDVNRFAEDMVTIKYRQEETGLEHDDFLFTIDTNRKTGEIEMNWKWASTLGALLPDPEAREAFQAEIANDNVDVFLALIGMRLKLSLRFEKGYVPAVSLGENNFVVKDSKGTEILGQGVTIDAAVQDAEAKGYKKAWVKSFRWGATHGQENIARFTASLVASQAVATSPFGNLKLAGGGSKI